MAEAIKMRVRLQGDIADIRILMAHPMENGQRKDDAGQTVPPHFIQSFTVSLNGTPLVAGQLNASIAKNPLFGFRARGVRLGDRIAAHWVDNRGNEQQDEVVVA